MPEAVRYTIKVLISAVLIVLVSEISKRSSTFGGLVASLPLVSLLAIIWLYMDTRDAERVAELSTSIFWLVIPSLVLFVVLPILLRARVGFWLSLASSAAATVVSYGAMLVVMQRLR
ncbi:MAG: DUF3147 family protein [Actinobacteria bacterium]|nr:DUF3147 family protein [Actinomycetota bacterium]